MLQSYKKVGIYASDESPQTRTVLYLRYETHLKAMSLCRPD